MKLAQIRSLTRGRVLGVTEVDLYRKDGHGTFGHASRDKKVAVISIHRLRDEHYGLPGDLQKLQERVLKEAIEQIGHTYGVVECSNPLCAMFDTSQLFDLDVKRPLLCPRCRRAIP